MARLLGLVVTVVLGSLVVAAPALAAVTRVDYNPVLVDPDFGHGSLLTITGEDTDGAHLNDNIRITQTADGYTIERLDTGGLLDSPAPECGGPVTNQTVINCAPAVDALSVDLRAGNDTLTTSAVTTPMQVAGGSENDFLQGGFGPDVLTGGDGIDTLIGRGGLDEFFGEGGNDTIDSRDGIAERISCGSGNDTVDNDFTDIIAECERGTDTDGDGFSTAVDCNDSAANIFPGAPEILENGIDENCNGVDDRNLDRDGDGFPIPGDCNDADPAIHPGAVEIRGNEVDENCDRRAESFAVLPSLVSATWRLTGHNTKLRKLVVRNAPKDARIVLTCKGPGCTFKKAKRLVVKRDLDPVGLDRFFGGTKTLRPRATVKVVVTAAQAVGRSYTWKIKKDEVPASSISCIPPGATKGRPC